MTTRRKPRVWTEVERSAIIEYLTLRMHDAEAGRDKLKSGLTKESPQWVWSNISYWDNVAKGYQWGLSLINRGGSKDAGKHKAGKDGGSK